MNYPINGKAPHLEPQPPKDRYQFLISIFGRDQVGKDLSFTIAKYSFAPCDESLEELLAALNEFHDRHKITATASDRLEERTTTQSSTRTTTAPALDFRSISDALYAPLEKGGRHEG